MKTVDFVTESNKIEGILRPPTQAEIDEHDRFVSLDAITLKDVEEFVSIYQPDAKIRAFLGMDVIVGSHIPPSGGPNITAMLIELLENIEELTPYQAHVKYETLHPFRDCNGRSGRALWAWHMMQTKGGYPLGFLHHFYYQSLDEGRAI